MGVVFVCGGDFAMRTKEEIVRNWLPRYTGQRLEDFSSHILLTNFQGYVDTFTRLTGVRAVTTGVNMPTVTADDITMVNFGIGSPNAATVMDLLSAVQPEAVLFLGKCGGLKSVNKLGDLILPIAAIRHEGTSDNYFPPEVPALPAFNLQRAASEIVQRAGCDYWTGSVVTTNRRVWEFDESFKDYLRLVRAIGVDMECATLFTVGFYNGIPIGALLLVSDQPMIAEGVKTARSDREVSSRYTVQHVQMGIDTLREIINHGESVRHLRF